MSDIMKSIPFGQLMEWILAEHKETGQVFGIQKAYVADTSKTVEIFGRKLENPVGPAAGRPRRDPGEKSGARPAAASAPLSCREFYRSLFFPHRQGAASARSHVCAPQRGRP